MAHGISHPVRPALPSHASQLYSQSAIRLFHVFKYIPVTMGSRPRSGPSGLGDPIRTEEPGRFVPQATVRSDCARLGQAGPEKGFWNISTCLEHHCSSSVLPCEGPHPDCFGCSGLAGSFLQVNLVSSRWNAPARGLIHITQFHTALSSHSTAYSPTRSRANGLARAHILQRPHPTLRAQTSPLRGTSASSISGARTL